MKPQRRVENGLCFTTPASGVLQQACTRRRRLADTFVSVSSRSVIVQLAVVILSTACTSVAPAKLRFANDFLHRGGRIVSAAVDSDLVYRIRRITATQALQRQTEAQELMDYWRATDPD